MFEFYLIGCVVFGSIMFTLKCLKYNKLQRESKAKIYEGLLREHKLLMRVGHAVGDDFYIEDVSGEEKVPVFYTLEKKELERQIFDAGERLYIIDEF